MTKEERIRPRDRDAILQSLSAGVVPRRGQHLIQVGRRDEIGAMVRDLERLEDGGSAVRFLIGQYGSGKTFFLHLTRSLALSRGFVTVHADLTPTRRIHSTGGHGRALFAELAHNMATRTSPEGGALAAVVERFVSRAKRAADKRGVAAEVVIREHLRHFTDLVGGFDFAEVVAAYWKGHETGDISLKESAIRWLRAEYSTRTDARRDLGVRQIISDANVYDSLKLMSEFAKAAGYKGLIVVLDEMVNLYKLPSTQARRSNYEQILRIVNDGLQGGVGHMAVIMGGTPEFLMDPRRGLYSYEALQTRLAENQFAVDGLKDLSGPVIRLSALAQEELFVLLEKLRNIQAAGVVCDYVLPDEALSAFMKHCSERVGASYFQTPRNTIKSFVHLMAVLEQNPGADWRTLLKDVAIEEDRGGAPEIDVPDVNPGKSDDLASFTL